MEAFMKLVGGKYLQDTLKQVITKVVETGLDCEVRMHCLHIIWKLLLIFQVLEFYPSSFRDVNIVLHYHKKRFKFYKYSVSVLGI